MNIEIEHAAVFTLYSTCEEAINPPCELEISEHTATYLQKLLQRSFESDEARTATLSRENKLDAVLASVRDAFFESSLQLAQAWHEIMRENPDISPADVVFAFASIDGDEVFAALKLPRKNSFVHRVDSGQSRLELIEGVLPTASGKPDEAFFVRLKDKALRLIEKKYEIDGHKHTYLSNRLIVCDTNHSPKEALSAICKAAVEVNQQFYGQLGADEPTVAAAVIEEFRAAPQELSAQRVCEKLYKDLPHAKEAFQNAMSQHDIPFDMPVVISAPAVRRLEKQSLRSGSGVEVKLPVSVYHNLDAVEFLKNDDGTTSLLIKNILM